MKKFYFKIPVSNSHFKNRKALPFKWLIKKPEYKPQNFSKKFPFFSNEISIIKHIKYSKGNFWFEFGICKLKIYQIVKPGDRMYATMDIGMSKETVGSRVASLASTFSKKKKKSNSSRK